MELCLERAKYSHFCSAARCCWSLVTPVSLPIDTTTASYAGKRFPTNSCPQKSVREIKFFPDLASSSRLSGNGEVPKKWQTGQLQEAVHGSNRWPRDATILMLAYINLLDDLLSEIDGRQKSWRHCLSLSARNCRSRIQRLASKQRSKPCGWHTDVRTVKARLITFTIMA